MKTNLLALSIVSTSETGWLLKDILESAGHKLVQCSGVEQARILINNGVEPDLVILDSSLVSAELADLLEVCSNAEACAVYGPGMGHQRGDFESLDVELFLKQPLDRSEVLSMLDLVCQSRNESSTRAGRANSQSSQLLVEEIGEQRYFLAAAPSMLKIYRQVELLADVDAPVLILGESGTGKEVIAHLIHKHSQRAQHRFVNVNCAALPTDLLESELFGYNQGAFTGAIKDKSGKFEQAQGGTLLLDEIGEMSAQMQAKLLHVLEDGQYHRLGSRESSKVDVRVLAATNVPIEEALIGRTFREDLFYRLNVFTIHVPALRDRREEIPYLIEEIQRRLPNSLRSGYEITAHARLMDSVMRYDWRGNVRELRNFVTRTVTMRDADNAVRELETKIAFEVRLPQGQASRVPSREAGGMRSVVRDMKDRAEAAMISDALEVSGWNRRHAARYLNISYRGLLYKIQQHNLVPRSPSSR